MNSHKLVIKLFAEGAAELGPEIAVPVFQNWIRDQALTDHLLIDVADYGHVPNGPGTVLVSLEANIHYDGENGPGLLYIRKQPVLGASTFRERLTGVVRAALEAAAKLESDPLVGGVRFNANVIVFRINDRLLGPNTEATYADVSSDLQSFFAELYQGDVALEHKHDAIRLFEVRVSSPAKATVTSLLARLAPAPALA